MKDVKKSCLGLILITIIFAILYVQFDLPIWGALIAGYIGAVIIDWLFI